MDLQPIPELTEGDRGGLNNSRMPKADSGMRHPVAFWVIGGNQPDPEALFDPPDGAEVYERCSEQLEDTPLVHLLERRWR